MMRVFHALDINKKNDARINRASFELLSAVLILMDQIRMESEEELHLSGKTDLAVACVWEQVVTV